MMFASVLRDHYWSIDVSRNWKPGVEIDNIKKQVMVQGPKHKSKQLSANLKDWIKIKAIIGTSAWFV